MYRRPKFLEILDEVREQMSHEADYDVDLFAEMVRQGKRKVKSKKANVKTGEIFGSPVTVFEELSDKS